LGGGGLGSSHFFFRGFRVEYERAFMGRETPKAYPELLRLPFSKPICFWLWQQFLSFSV
jgi:hypothetical protein